MDDSEDSETGPELAKLISQRRHRPSYSRMISWEMSHAALQQPAKKRRVMRKTSGNASTDIFGDDSNDDDNDDDNAANAEYLSEYVGSAVDTAKDDLVEESAPANGTDAFSFEQESIESVLIGTQRMNLRSTNIPTGRRKRLSKKQKKKRKSYFTTYLEELYNLANIFDPSNEIDSVFNTAAEIGGDADVVRVVPSLVELCLAASNKKPRSGSKKEQPNIRQLPRHLKNQVISRAVERKEQQQLLAFIQNYILPRTLMPSTEHKLVLRDCFYSFKTGNLVPIVKRSVWTLAAVSESAFTTTCCTSNVSLQTVSVTYYLYAIDVQPFNFETHCYDCHFEYAKRSPAYATLTSVFGTMMDLMLPAQLLNNPDSDWQSDTRYKFALVRLKRALYARYQPLVDLLFDHALAYVMWARGHVAIATNLFKGLIEKQTNVLQKAMYLSEIALMHAIFGDSLTAVQFYRSAGETALLDQKRHDQQDQAVKEVTEQTQILLASVYDRGLLTREKCEMSCSHWAAGRHLPNARQNTIVASFDSFLTLAAAHIHATSCWQEGIAKINLIVKDCPYLYYYQSMLYALMGNEVESSGAYQTLQQLSPVVPGIQIVSIIGQICKTPWQPVTDVTKGQPVSPLKVVWRAQLQHTVLERHCPMEAQVLSKRLNLRLNNRGQICADLQMLLPPMRNIAFDPYTGCIQLNSFQGATEPWVSSFYEYTPFLNLVYRPHNYVPTKVVVFSGNNGSTIELLSLSTNDACLTEECIKPVCMLYWADSQGRHAKLDIYARIKNIMKTDLTAKLHDNINNPKHPFGSWDEEDKAMAFKLIDVAYKRDLLLKIETIRSGVEQFAQAKKEMTAAKKSAKNAKKQKAEIMKDDLLPLNPKTTVKLVCEPFLSGETIIMQVEVYAKTGSITFLIAVDTSSKEAFLNFEIKRLENKGRIYTIEVLTAKDYFIERQSESLIVYRCPLDVVMRIHKRYSFDQTLTPVIIGSDLYLQNNSCTGILRLAIFETDEIQNLTDDNLVWLPSIHPFIRRLDVIGQTTELLLVTMDHGLGVMVPGLMELLDVNVNEQVDFRVHLNGDGNVILGNFSTSRLLSQAESCTNYIIYNRLMLSAQNKLLVLEVVSAVAQSTHRLNVTHCFVLPGFVKEICFVGKFHILISCSQQETEDEEFYREHLFLYDRQGHLKGALPCLEKGPRSFLPMYLPGTEGTGSECRPGWRVYMRDGRGGIICVQLDI